MLCEATRYRRAVRWLCDGRRFHFSRNSNCTTNRRSYAAHTALYVLRRSPKKKHWHKLEPGSLTIASEQDHLAESFKAIGMSNEPSEELRCLEMQGQVLLKASLLISIYSLYPTIVSSDAELLINELLSPVSIEIAQQTTALVDVLRRYAQLAGPAVLPSLVVYATRRSSFDAVHSALLEGFVGRAAEVHDKLPTLRARAAVGSPHRAMSVVSPPISPAPVQVDSKYISILQEWASSSPQRRITWEDSASGPSHMRVFEVTCSLNGEVIGKGIGGKKQVGKAQAAYDAAKFLGLAADPNSALLRA